MTAGSWQWITRVTLPTAYCILPTQPRFLYAFPNSRSSVSGFGFGVSRLTTTSRPIEISAAG